MNLKAWCYRRWEDNTVREIYASNHLRLTDHFVRRLDELNRMSPKPAHAFILPLLAQVFSTQPTENMLTAGSRMPST